VRPGPAC